MEIITAVNEKGGVGKTTTIIALADTLKRRGYRTLVIDLDGQGNLTTHLSRRQGFLDSLTFMQWEGDIVGDNTDKKQIPIEKSEVGDLIVFNQKIDLLDSILATEVGTKKYKLLKKAIASFKDKYDFVLVDPPARIGLAIQNVLIASTSAVIMAEPNPYSLDGIRKIAVTLKGIKDDNPELLVTGVLITKYRGFVTEEQVIREIKEETQSLLGCGIFENMIRNASAVNDANDSRIPLSLLSGKGKVKAEKVIEDYELFTDELLKKIKEGKQ